MVDVGVSGLVQMTNGSSRTVDASDASLANDFDLSPSNEVTVVHGVSRVSSSSEQLEMSLLLLGVVGGSWAVMWQSTAVGAYSDGSIVDMGVGYSEGRLVKVGSRSVVLLPDRLS